MPEIESALTWDVIVIVSCSILLLKYGRLAHSHPATIYLFFHIYAFTFRLVGIWYGSPTLFSNWGARYEPVAYSEIIRAVTMADIALVVMTLAWLRVSASDFRQNGPLPEPEQTNRANLSWRYTRRIVTLAFPIGLLGILLFTRIPFFTGLDATFLGEWTGSSWLRITQTWVGLSLLALIYWFGFRWQISIPMLLYLLLMSYQGYHRFRVLIPMILMFQIYLDQRGRKWPTISLAALLLAVSLLYFPLKTVGRMAQQGATLEQIQEASMAIINSALSGEDSETFLDQFASSVTLTDRADKFYYGRTYLPILTLPIPRQWWPDKPGLADHLQDISSPGRPMRQTGMITTILGEAYVNFGYVGIVVIPFLIARWLGRAYFWAYRNNYYSVSRMGYLLVACNLIQVYRDGLISIIVFTLINMMPLMVIILLHYIFPEVQEESQKPKHKARYGRSSLKRRNLRTRSKRARSSF